MFKQVFPLSAPEVNILVDGQQVAVKAGLSVTAALLSVGLEPRRTSHTHAEHGPFCHMGVCYECLMEIDGKPNQQACLVEVKEGMHIKRQHNPVLFRQEEAAQ